MKRLSHGFVTLLVWVLVAIPLPSRAATNVVRGGIGGIDNGTLLGGDGTGAAKVTINVTGLALVKQARDLTGRVLADSSTVTAGDEIYFVLYVENPTDYAAQELQITDALDESAFTYYSSSLESASIPAGSSDAAIWAAAWTPVTDAVNDPDDIASIADTGGPSGPDRITIGAVPGQTNRAAELPGRTLRAVRFRVRVN
ncbi:MAG: hypothetical protein ACKVU1_13190 [bacterium]